jgi:hypothetical protein
MFDSAAEVEAALARGDLEETHVFDGKRQLGQNRDSAIDVCAMTVDGGTLLYGVDEDENGRVTLAAPIELAGQRERIDQIVQTSIMEPPTIYVSELPREEAPEQGYLLVTVPRSPRAPHQVVVGNDLRYYGRGATGNRRLTEGEVAALYQRRAQWALDRDAHLETVIQSSPFGLDGLEGFAYLHAFARPFGFDSGFLRRQWVDEDQGLPHVLVAAASRNHIPPHRDYRPDLRQQRGWSLDGSGGIRVGSGEDTARDVIWMTIGRDGEARLFCCCGARFNDDRPVSIYDYLLGGNLAAFFAVAGAFYSQADYIGAVDVGAAVTGIHRAHSHFRVVEQQHMGDRVTGAEGIDQHEHRRTERVLAPALHERPHEITDGLLRDLSMSSWA